MNMTVFLQLDTDGSSLLKYFSHTKKLHYQFLHVFQYFEITQNMLINMCVSKSINAVLIIS